MIGALQRRVLLLVGRAVIEAVKAGGGRVHVTFDSLAGQTSGDVELAEPWGLTSIPMAGSEAVTLSVMGEPGNRVAISMGDRSVRPRDGVPGETILFDEQGQRIAIKRDRVEIAAKRLVITAPEASINGRAIATVGHEVNVAGGSSAGRHSIVTGVGDD